MQSSLKKDEEWVISKAPSLSTVGIGPVFCISSSDPRHVELTGTIKSRPEDFIVREIGLARHHLNTTNREQRVASMQLDACMLESTLPKSIPIAEMACNTNDSATHCLESRKKAKTDEEQGAEKCKNKDTIDGEVASVCSTSKSENQLEGIDEKNAQSSLSPMEVITSILKSTYPNDQNSYKLSWEVLLQSIESLHLHALGRLKDIETKQSQTVINVSEPADPSVSDSDTEQMLVWIPPLPFDAFTVPGLDSTGKGGDRGAFHRAHRAAFPLLVSATATLHESDSCTADLNNERQRDTMDRWIKISLDSTFDELIPKLVRPSQDLLALYRFRNLGCNIVARNESSNWRGTEQRSGDDHNRSSTGRRKGFHATGSIVRGNDSSATENESNLVLLHLFPDASREDRRNVHHLIAGKCRDFETGTRIGAKLPIHDNSIDKGSITDEDSITTTAIVIRWSKQALRSTLRKEQKRKVGSMVDCKNKISKHREEVSSTLCVVMKKQTEHLNAINQLSAAIKCRPSDIGLAGIKDMQAITYQYCTLRHVAPNRVLNANNQLRRNNMDIKVVRGVDWVLNRGELEGNRFEICVQDLHQLELRDKEMKESEPNLSIEIRRSPCHESFLEECVSRVQRGGFVNFYGEQRVGNAGDSADIGVRSFDIGRAMLQKKWTKAVNLIMIGRSLTGKGGEFVEGPERRLVRSTWKESGGDPIKALKVFPRDANSMPRERAVLQGLKRYKDPLAALQCLQFSVRTFWINAYQSYIWNLVATERIQRHGMKPILGDLYWPQGESSESKKNVKVITHDPSMIDIRHIVLPLPGSNVQYPTNDIGDMYGDLLKKDDIVFEKGAIAESTAKGSYRSLISTVGNLECQGIANDTDKDYDDKEKTVHAARIAFDLESGSYATMVLRELFCATMAR
eukprot:scaffold8660_cov50-Attheya_sp.AAC.3